MKDFTLKNKKACVLWLEMMLWLLFHQSSSGAGLEPAPKLDVGLWQPFLKNTTGITHTVFKLVYCKQHLEIKLAVAWDSLGNNFAAPSLPCFCFGSRFISFVVILSFLPPVYTKDFTTKRNGCRESCSRVNWSISARLKTADGVACKHYCRQGKFQSRRQVIRFSLYQHQLLLKSTV